MSTFTEKEVDYLRTQRLGRIATVGSDGKPHVVPVGFRLAGDAETIEIGGHGLSKSKKAEGALGQFRVSSSSLRIVFALRIVIFL